MRPHMLLPSVYSEGKGIGGMGSALCLLPGWSQWLRKKGAKAGQTSLQLLTKCFPREVGKNCNHIKKIFSYIHRKKWFIVTCRVYSNIAEKGVNNSYQEIWASLWWCSWKWLMSWRNKKKNRKWKTLQWGQQVGYLQVTVLHRGGAFDAHQNPYISKTEGKVQGNWQNGVGRGHYKKNKKCAMKNLCDLKRLLSLMLWLYVSWHFHKWEGVASCAGNWSDQQC